MLIIFSGLPGTGKTTLAKGVAARLGAVYLRIDTIEQAIVRSSLGVATAEEAGYLAGYGVAAENLRLGRVVVADSVNPIELTREAWSSVAREAGCIGVNVEVVCSDTAEHRRRVETRRADLAGHRLPTWQDVLDRDYRAWTEDRIVIDTAGSTVGDCIEALLERLSERSAV